MSEEMTLEEHAGNLGRKFRHWNERQTSASAGAYLSSIGSSIVEAGYSEEFAKAQVTDVVNFVMGRGSENRFSRIKMLHVLDEVYATATEVPDSNLRKYASSEQGGRDTDFIKTLRDRFNSKNEAIQTSLHLKEQATHVLVGHTSAKEGRKTRPIKKGRTLRQRYGDRHVQ